MATYSKLLLCILFFVANQLLSQVPNISYSNSSYTFTVGSAISQLTPTNIGGKVAEPGSVSIGVVSTLAGPPSYADSNGTAIFYLSPFGLAVDRSKNVYVADDYNNCIRKISPTGIVNILAGSGIQGFLNGNGPIARFNIPKGVAVDDSGYVYVADQSNNLIRKISPLGVVSTYAGNGSQGYTDGNGTEASFNLPNGLAVDNIGNIYVADTWNHCIRKINPAGMVSTLAGSNTAGFIDGKGAAARFHNPYGVALDGSGNVYVADAGNHIIRRISPSGEVTTLAGSGTRGFLNGNATVARFNYPFGVVVDGGGNIYVADNTNHCIRKISPAGVVTTLAGSTNFGYVDATGAAAKFYSPNGVAVDSSGNVYVADYYNKRIRKISQIVGGGYTVNPALPAGLSLNARTGVISGTPILAAPATAYTITAINAFGEEGTTAITIATICTENHWTGVMNDRWDNPENWSCKILPDGSQNVVISGGKPNAPIVRSNVTIRSLRQYGPSELTIANGVTFKILE